MKFKVHHHFKLNHSSASNLKRKLATLRGWGARVGNLIYGFVWCGFSSTYHFS